MQSGVGVTRSAGSGFWCRPMCRCCLFTMPTSGRGSSGGGAVVTSVAAGERAGEIGFELLRGVRLAGLGASDAVLRPRPLFD